MAPAPANTLKIAAFGAFFLALVVWVSTFASRPGYYPNVVVEVPNNLQLFFLFQGNAEQRTCEATAASVATGIQATCAACKVTARQCLTKLKPDHQKMLSGEPIDLPSSRMPGGVVVYSSAADRVAFDACREADRKTAADTAFRATCFPANTLRPSGDVPHPGAGRGSYVLSGFLVLLLSCLTAGFASYLIVRYQALHSRWSTDLLDARPQKFHSVPTPRVGGLCLIMALFGSQVALGALEQRLIQEEFAYLLFAGLPAFVVGISEDVTKSVGIQARLAVTMLAASWGAWLLHAIVPRVDVAGIDALLKWAPIAIAFTIFAVAGLSNAMNIIDGYNGLAAGYGLIVLAALSYVSMMVRDYFLLFAALAMAGALLGFLTFNYPKGRIFLGDSGAYLLGFWLADISVLLIARHPEVSPWFPLALLIYPVFETLFSIYRRKLVRGESPGHPDRLHMHQLIYMRLIRKSVGSVEPELMTQRNSRVAPYIWVFSALFCAVSVIAWKNTGVLMMLVFLFCIAYIWIYIRIVRWHAPAWLVQGTSAKKTSRSHQ